MGFTEEREAEADQEPGPTTAEVVEGAWRAIEVAWTTIGSLVQGSWRKPEAAASRIHNDSTIPGLGIHNPETWQSHALSSLLIGLSAVNRPPSEDEATDKAPAEGMQLVGGPGVIICNECVELCREILDERHNRS